MQTSSPDTNHPPVRCDACITPSKRATPECIHTDALAPNTRSLYECRWRKFTDWCAAEGLSPLPASVDTVARFLRSLPVRGTNYFFGFAIRHYHRQAGLESPWTAELAALAIGADKVTLGIGVNTAIFTTPTI
jgi:hypothetical protein